MVNHVSPKMILFGTSVSHYDNIMWRMRHVPDG
jgi:hypothetical protein